MILTEMLSLGFALVALLGCGYFFVTGKNIAGFAFLAAFVVSLAGVSKQRVVLTSMFLGVTVEKQSASLTGDLSNGQAR